MVSSVFYIVTLDKGEVLFSGNAAECMDYLFYLQVKVICDRGIALIDEPTYKRSHGKEVRLFL